MTARSFVVTERDAGARLDRFLHEQRPDLSRSLLQRLIERGGVTIDGRPGRSAEKIRAGQTVQVEMPAPEPVGLVPAKIP
ncbi:MAG TPA: S4 domain-containing protein, partial [Chloroflexota bacterium]|nr:S4 domain-containing protein [Chloroflexota bacterium]